MDETYRETQEKIEVNANSQEFEEADVIDAGAIMKEADEIFG